MDQLTRPADQLRCNSDQLRRKQSPNKTDSARAQNPEISMIPSIPDIEGLRGLRDERKEREERVERVDMVDRLERF